MSDNELIKDLRDEADICSNEFVPELAALLNTAAHRIECLIDKDAQEMDAVAIQYAHKLALDLECVLSGGAGRWWNSAMKTLGEYRSAMNAIHERISPTHMGEPVIKEK